MDEKCAESSYCTIDDQGNFSVGFCDYYTSLEDVMYDMALLTDIQYMKIVDTSTEQRLYISSDVFSTEYLSYLVLILGSESWYLFKKLSILDESSTD